MKINVVRVSQPSVDASQGRRDLMYTTYIDPYLNPGSIEWNKKIRSILTQIDIIKGQTCSTTKTQADLEYVINGVTYYHMDNIGFVDEITTKHDFDRALYIKMCSAYFSGNRIFDSRKLFKYENMKSMKYRRRRKSIHATKI